MRDDRQQREERDDGDRFETASNGGQLGTFRLRPQLTRRAHARFLAGNFVYEPLRYGAQCVCTSRSRTLRHRIRARPSPFD